MASLIVDEGDGSREHPLSTDRTIVGSNPQCDLTLGHRSATGTRFIIDSGARPCRITVLKGQVLLNERSVLASELRHNDLLRVGECTLLYRDPPTGDAARPRSPAQADAAATLAALARLRDRIGETPGR